MEEWFGSRYHSWVPEPDTLFPFSAMGVDSCTARFGSPEYYAWKYEPYAERFNDLPHINGRIELNGQKMLRIFKHTSSMADVIPYSGPADSTDLRIGTFSHENHPLGRFHVFVVNTDMPATTQPITFAPSAFKVKVSSDSLLLPPGDYQVVNLTTRRLISSWSESGPNDPVLAFRDTLAMGEAHLLHIIGETCVVPDFSVHSRDLTLTSNGSDEQPFIYGDSVTVELDVYNLSPLVGGTAEIQLYRNVISDSTELGPPRCVTLPALTDSIPQQSQTILVNGIANAIGPVEVIAQVRATAGSCGSYIWAPEADTLNNVARQLILIHPLDYARDEMQIVYGQWDFSEKVCVDDTCYSADVVDFGGLVTVPSDSLIPGIWEGEHRSGDYGAAWVELRTGEDYFLGEDFHYLVVDITAAYDSLYEGAGNNAKTDSISYGDCQYNQSDPLCSIPWNVSWFDSTQADSGWQTLSPATGCERNYNLGSVPNPKAGRRTYRVMYDLWEPQSDEWAQAQVDDFRFVIMDVEGTTFAEDFKLWLKNIYLFADDPNWGDVPVCNEWYDPHAASSPYPCDSY